MSTDSISVKPAILITIISEFVLKDRIVKLLKSKDVTGYTISEVRGEGGHGRRMGDIAGYNTNVEIKTVVTTELSDDIFKALRELRNGHALVAFRHNVEILSD